MDIRKLNVLLVCGIIAKKHVNLSPTLSSSTLSSSVRFLIAGILNGFNLTAAEIRIDFSVFVPPSLNVL